MPPALTIETVLNSRFRIKQVLWEEPHRNTYLIHDFKITDKLWIAYEYVLSSVSESNRKQVREIFEQRAKVIKTFSHPNLMQIVDFFDIEDRLWLITEFVEGLSLEAMMRFVPNPISETDLLKWGRQISHLLDYLHHVSPPFFINQLSPRHIRVDREGDLKVGGFGIDSLFESKSPKISTEGAATDLNFLGRCLLQVAKSIESNEDVTVSSSTMEVVRQCLGEPPAKPPPSAYDIQRKFNNLLHPSKPRRVERKKALGLDSKKVQRSFRQSILWTAKTMMDIVHRPYLIILLAVAAALVFYQKSGKPYAFKKTGGLFYVFSPKEITVLDAATLEPLSHIHGNWAYASAIRNADGKIIWIASRDGSLDELDATQGTLIHQSSLRQEIGGIALGPSQRLLVTLTKSNVLEVLSPDGIPIATAPIANSPRSIVFNPPKNEIYAVVKNIPAMIFIIDALHYTQKQPLLLDKTPSQIAVSQDGKLLFVSYANDKRIEVFDTDTKKPVNTIITDATGPYILKTTEKGLIVTSHRDSKIFFYDSFFNKTTLVLGKPGDAMTDENGNILACNDAGYLNIINVNSGKIRRVAKVGKYPFQIIQIP